MPEPLRRLRADIELRVPGKATIELVPLLIQPGEAGLRFLPFNPRSAPVFVIFGGGSFYIEVGDAMSLDSWEYVPEAEGYDFALKAVLDAALYGAFKISRRTKRGWVKSSMSFSPESAEERETVTVAPDETVDVSYEPW